MYDCTFEEVLEYYNQNPWAPLREDDHLEHQRVLVVNLTEKRSMEFEQERREKVYQY